MIRENQDAEFVVIGSGPAGVSAALPLTEAGRNVLMIDGSEWAVTPWPKAPNPMAPWHQMLGNQLEAVTSVGNQSPKLETPYARQITGSFVQDTGISAENFLPVGAIARGGLSTIWGAFASEYDSVDLRDWPVTADEMRPFYKEIVERIGVSGTMDDDQSEFYGGSAELDPALPVGPTANWLYARYRRRPRNSAFSLGLARNAIITRDRIGRQACDLRQSCLWGCEIGAIYDSRSDLKRLLRRENFRMLDSAFAVRLRRVLGGWEILLRDGRQVRAPKIILAAGCLTTTQLALGAMTAPPSRLRVLNNPVMAIPLLVPARLGSRMPMRGHTLAQLGYRYKFESKGDDYVTGGIYEVGALPSWSFVSKMPFSKRNGMKLFSAFSPAMLIATCYFPANLSDNSLTWTEVGDRVNIHVRGGVSPGLANIADATRRALRGKFRSLGAWTMPGTTIAMPGTDVHYGGTLPMGSPCSHGTSVAGELNGAPGVFVADGAAFPSLPAKYPTLTIMANATRIAKGLLRN